MELSCCLCGRGFHVAAVQTPHGPTGPAGRVGNTGDVTNRVNALSLRQVGHSQLMFFFADSSDAVDLPAGSYTGGVTNLTAKAADEAAAELPAVAFT